MRQKSGEGIGMLLPGGGGAATEQAAPRVQRLAGGSTAGPGAAVRAEGGAGGTRACGDRIGSASAELGLGISELGLCEHRSSAYIGAQIRPIKCETIMRRSTTEATSRI
jgi:hypothetical protein